MTHINAILAPCGALLIALTTACGGSGGSGGAADGAPVAGSDLLPVITHFDNGQVETTGTLDAEGQRQGAWQVFAFDGQLLFEGEFVDDALDHSQPWTHWNSDGSVRYDQDDGPHPAGGPW
ncbi:MAG: hypothetical protein PF961_04240 [Planctomycetota bacterium]|jgi:hypothetical protein|nr:hypothetical protein [Planctomycetota bacterium]